MRLRVQDIDLGNGVLMVRQGKGKKGRKISLPVSIISQLENQINRVRNIFDDDLKVKFQGAFVPKEIGSKSKNAGKKWIWQFFFPGASLVFVKGECALKRYHLHDTALQKAFQKAVALDKIPKRVTIHSGIVMPPISYSWDLISGPYRSCWGMGIFAHNVAFSRAVYRFAKQRFVGNHLYCATLAIIASASFREEKLVIT